MQQLSMTGAKEPGARAAAPGATGETSVAGAPMPAHVHAEGVSSVPSLCSSDRAEFVTDDGAPRRDDSVLAEAERIKAVLLNDQEKSEDALLELLRRLQQLDLTTDTLEATAIGKAVGNFRKHSSQQIRNLVRSLIECPEQSWRQERSVKKEHLVAEMLAGPSNAESAQGRPQSAPDDKPAISQDENSVPAELEATKRRLQKRYQEAVNAKKQRSIQVVELN